METKIWDCSFSREDVEVLIGRTVNNVEWDMIVDSLYNNDKLYKEISDMVYEIAKEEVGD